MKNKKVKRATPSIQEQLTQGILYLYIIIMVGAHPIVYKNHFFGMVSAKTQLFWFTALLLFVLMFVIQVYSLCTNPENIKIAKMKQTLSKWSITDWCVLTFFFVVIGSWATSAYRAEAFYGAPGWFVGVATLLACCVSYYYISRYFTYRPSVIWTMLFVNIGIGSIALLNHFRVDPLGMFTNVREEDWAIFISTIGNINLYSSYLCVIIPLFMVLFCICKTRNSEIVFGGFLVLEYMNLVVVNSDSVFLGVGAAFVLLLWFAKDSWTAFRKYVSLVVIFLVSVQVMGLMQRIFEARAIKLAALSDYFARSTLILGFIPVAILILVLVCKWEEKEIDVCALQRAIKVVFGGGVVLVFVMLVLVVWVNTSDMEHLPGWAQYLKFGDAWGSQRGFIWRYCFKLYQDFPIGKKLVGCGPDTLYYAMADTYYQDMVNYLNAVFSNAHSEFIQLLVTVGLAGALSYFGMLISSGFRFAKESKNNPMLLAVAAVVVSYIAQGIVNNPQYITTPLLFIMIGLGESMVRKKNKI